MDRTSVSARTAPGATAAGLALAWNLRRALVALEVLGGQQRQRG